MPWAAPAWRIPSLYTMRLNADGSVALRLNCNSATGTWSAEAAGSDPSSGRFEFGPLAATMALCPPPSLDEQVTKQAPYFRSYLLNEGRLYLSLMADGGIFVWEPMERGAMQRCRVSDGRSRRTPWRCQLPDSPANRPRCVNPQRNAASVTVVPAFGDSSSARTSSSRIRRDSAIGDNPNSRRTTRCKVRLLSPDSCASRVIDGGSSIAFTIRASARRADGVAAERSASGNRQCGWNDPAPDGARHRGTKFDLSLHDHHLGFRPGSRPAASTTCRRPERKTAATMHGSAGRWPGRRKSV